ncbi:serpin family protein [Oceanobacillus kimchii]|uniref:serpin family protein n=1 Tax=Oceanobacillus kimchii TaxID=746691 RepID=UPI00034A491C|nr:serpin family protein [Oceanobacillus kimchii]MCT1576835.1 serpin family protein [Oceanobacillus kimchii]MCT2134905.1 serpin family protein [Oceanobacillus kimchii]
MKKCFFIFSILCLFLLFSACGTDNSATGGNNSTDAPPTTKIDTSVLVNDANQASNHLGFQTLQRLKGNEEDNIFVSPISIWLAVSMAYNGADGDTKDEMTNALQLGDIDLQTLNEHNASMMDQVSNHDDVELNILNSIWLRPKFTFLEDFEQQVTESYNPELGPLTTKEPMNEWVSEKTNGKITNLIEKVDEDHVAFLLNATYFNGNWKYPFDENNTDNDSFNLDESSITEVPFMSLDEKLFYWENDEFQLVALPYGEEGNIQMEVFLPNESIRLQEFVNKLTLEDWQNWRESMQETVGSLKMPKFSLEYESELQDFFQALGMEKAFDQNIADFSNMIDPAQLRGNLYISKIMHKTFLEVDERGTEAAGATSVEMKEESAIVSPAPFQMEINRPFLLTISDNETDTILFMGMIHEPTSID